MQLKTDNKLSKNKITMKAIVIPILVAISLSRVIAEPIQIGATVPLVEGKNLRNEALVLPEDLAGKPAVIAFGFSRTAGSVIRSWIEQLNDDPKLFQVPVLEGVPSLFRSITEMIISKDTKPKRHSEVILLYKNEKEWRARLKVEDDELAYLLVVDSDGKVIDRLSGALSKSSVARVRKAVAEAVSK